MIVYKKKYGRITVNAWLNSELERSSPIFMLVCGILFAVGGILVRAFVGSPYRVMLELGIKDMIPPVWLMTFLWTIAFFMAGCAFGFVLCYRWAGCEAEKYKGCMVFVLMAVLELCRARVLHLAGSETDCTVRQEGELPDNLSL